MRTLSVEIFLRKLWEKFRDHCRIGLPSPPVASVFTVDASFYALAPNPVPPLTSFWSYSILMCSKNLSVQNW